MPRILLLGKDGQLGWELARSAASLGEIVGLGSRELDLARGEDVRAAVRRIRPDVILNAAAYTAVDRAESEPERALAVNAMAPAILAEEARSLEAALIHFSTDFVFDGEKQVPYREEDPTRPLNAYGRSKLAGEEAVRQAGVAAHLVLRTSWVYSLRRESFVTKVLEWAGARPTLRIVEDQVGSPTWCRDLAHCTTRILSMAGPDPRAFLADTAGIYHVAGAGAVSRFEWAREILRLDPGRDQHVVREVLPARSEEFPLPAARPRYSALACEKLQRTFGLSPRPWREALRDALAEREPGALPAAAAASLGGRTR
jgi:dTDP-4-dehydrorhamnose reductase